MSLSLYDATVPSYLQLLRALPGVIAKGEAHAAEKGLDDLTGARLIGDMAPLAYQIRSTVTHSTGALAGVRAGLFTPDMTPPPSDLAVLRGMVNDAIVVLDTLDPEEVNALADVPVRFEVGTLKLDFTGANFLLSFAQPNFYFHVTMAYGVLRALGVPLGKRDYLGVPRVTP